MNRQNIAVESIVQMACLIVGHPERLQHRSRQFGNSTILYLKAVKSDTGRLIGPKGSIFQTLKMLGQEISMTEFDLIVEEGTEDFPPVTFKSWNPIKAKHSVERMVSGMFGNASVKWTVDGSSDLIEVELESGYEQDRIDRIAEGLKVIMNSIGRAHNRVIKIWLAEVSSK